VDAVAAIHFRRPRADHLVDRHRSGTGITDLGGRGGDRPIEGLEVKVIAGGLTGATTWTP